jgi:tetratricopeptide (TPR) repeat protein
MNAAWLLIAGAIAGGGIADAQIAGRVVANGGPPPERAWVTVHCEGPATWDWGGYADRRGEFLSSAPDGRAEFGPDSDGFCEIVAIAHGFERGVARTTHTRESNVLVTLRPLAPGDDTVRYADIAVPENARKWFDRAAEDARARRWKPAEEKLRKALAAFPSYALAWSELGAALQSQGKQDAAAEAYTKALAIDARLTSAAVRLAVLQAGQQRWAEVASTTGAAVDDPTLFFYNAVANYNLGRLDAAERSARRAAELRFPRAHYILGRVLAAKGQFGPAAAEMSKYLELMPDAADAPRVRAEIRDAAARARQ